MIMVVVDRQVHGAYAFDVAELSVCTDCIMLLANGEGSGETVDAITARWGDQGRHLVPGGDELGFSTTECDTCGDALHGDRFAAALLAPVL